MRSPRPLLERDVYLYVDRVHDVHADLVARRAMVVQPPTVAPYGVLEFVAEDPDGHRIAFGGMLPEA